MKDLILNLCPTGLIPRKSQSQYVPITPREIVDDVLIAAEKGITMVHLHARDSKTEEPKYQRDIYGEIISGIRKYQPELIICASLSGRSGHSFEQRTDVLELTGSDKPDMGSLTLSSLNFNNVASINTPEIIMQMAQKMLDKKVKPELEVFDVGMINYANYLIAKGLLKPPYYFNLLFGNIACAQANLSHMGNMQRDLPEDSIYSFGGVGRFQQMVTSVAVAAGAGVRIGLEDNLWLDSERSQLARNIDFVDKIHRLAAENGRPIMSSKALREKLELTDGANGLYGVL